MKAAFESIPGLAAELAEIVAVLPERLVDYLVVAYLEGTRPVLARTLALAGIAGSRTEPASGTRPSYLRRELRFDHLSRLFEDPAALVQDLYGWGAADLDDALLLGRLGDLLTAVNLPATYDPGAHELSALIFRLRAAPGTPASFDMELGLNDLTGVDQHIAIGRGDWTIHIVGKGALALDAGLRITPPLTVTPPQAGVAADATFTVALERGAPGGAPFVLFGAAGGTRFEATSVSLGAGAHFVTEGAGVAADLLVEGGVANGNLVIDLGGADGFLSSILPDDLRLQPDLDVQYSEATGVTFRGGAGLALTIPIDLPLGPARLDRLDLAFRIATTGLTLETRLTGGATIGPFSAVVEGVGAGADLLFHQGNLGPADLQLRFLRAPRPGPRDRRAGDQRRRLHRLRRAARALQRAPRPQARRVDRRQRHRPARHAHPGPPRRVRAARHPARDVPADPDRLRVRALVGRRPARAEPARRRRRAALALRERHGRADPRARGPDPQRARAVRRSRGGVPARPGRRRRRAHAAAVVGRDRPGSTSGSSSSCPRSASSCSARRGW